MALPALTFGNTTYIAAKQYSYLAIYIMALQELDRVFGALADPTRRAILARLARGEATVNELVAPFDLAQPTISKHLKVLETCGARVARPRCAVPPGPAQRGASPGASPQWVGDYQRFWEESLDQLGDYAKELQRKEARHAKSKRK